MKIFTQSVSSPLTNVYDATKIPFAFISQYLLSEKLLIVQHSTLHKISEAMTGLEGDCVLIHNTARCGSTLLCQVSLSKILWRIISSSHLILFNFHTLLQLKRDTLKKYQVNLINKWVQIDWAMIGFGIAFLQCVIFTTAF